MTPDLLALLGFHGYPFLKSCQLGTRDWFGCLSRTRGRWTERSYKAVRLHLTYPLVFEMRVVIWEGGREGDWKGQWRILGISEGWHLSL